MCRGLMVAAMTLFATVAVMAAESPHRLVVIVGKPGDPRVAHQHAVMEQSAAALRERDVVLQDVTPETALRNRPELGVQPQTAFEVLLVGKDGGVKLRRDRLVSPSGIIALIDTMPMRQEEMRRK
jgi:hypothetical protein